MKTKVTVGGIAEFVGVAAVVGSGLFVGQQIIQAQAIALNEMGMLTLQIRVEANDQINENADIWVAGLTGEELGPAEQIIFENLLTG